MRLRTASRVSSSKSPGSKVVELRDYCTGSELHRTHTAMRGSSSLASAV